MFGFLEKSRRRSFLSCLLFFALIFLGGTTEKAQAALSYVGGVVGSRTGSTSAGQALSLTALTGGSGSTAAAGDIVIAACSTGSVADRAVGVSTPTGYAELNEPYANSGTDTNFSVSWKIMGGTPDTSVTCGPSGSTADALSAVAHVWRGVDSGTPFDVNYTTATGTTTGRPTPPAISPSTAGTIIIAIGAGAAGTGANYTTATLSNFITTTGADTYDSMLAMGSYAWSSGTYTPAQFGGGTTGGTDSWAADTLALRPLIVNPPSVSTQAASSVEETTVTGNGNITATGGATVTRRGFCYMVGTSGDPTTADSVAYDDGSFGTGAYTKGLTGLASGTSYRVRAYAVNSAGTGYGTTVQILTKPAAPTSVAATDGTLTDKVTITWTKSTGATDYHVWRDSTDLGAAGDVATFDDTGAGAPTITAGSAVASDGTSATQVDLSLSGTSFNNGTSYTYKVVASNATGNSVDSATNAGYRGYGTPGYQWQRSAADSDASYSDLGGATGATYNDTGAPADGSARYYRCVLNATGATQQISTANRGYKGVVSITLEPGSGTVTYGSVVTSKDTTASGVNQTQSVRNTGNVAVDLDFRSQNSADWTLGLAAGNATYVHEFCFGVLCDSSPTWIPLTTTYDGAFLSSVSPDTVIDFDLKVTVPTSNPGTNQQSVDVFVMAIQS